MVRLSKNQNQRTLLLSVSSLYLSSVLLSSPAPKPACGARWAHVYFTRQYSDIDLQLQNTRSAATYSSGSYAYKLSQLISQIVSRGGTEESSQDTTKYASILHKESPASEVLTTKYWNQSCHVTQTSFNV